MKSGSWFLVWLIILPWRWRQYVHPKLRLTFNELHGAISQKTELFIRQLVAIIIRSCIISVFYLTVTLLIYIYISWDIYIDIFYCFICLYYKTNCRKNPHVEEIYLWKYNEVQSVESQLTFRRNISPPSSGSKNKRNKVSVTSFHACFLIGTLFDPEDGWKSVDFQRTTRRYIPENRTLHNHLCENLKSYKPLFSTAD
jgi:hypothetical protein